MAISTRAAQSSEANRLDRSGGPIPSFDSAAPVDAGSSPTLPGSSSTEASSTSPATSPVEVAGREVGCDAVTSDLSGLCGVRPPPRPVGWQAVGASPDTRQGWLKNFERLDFT